MQEEQIKTMLDETGIPYEYMKFEEGEIQPPFIVWYYGESTSFYADGVCYAKVDSIVIELYSDEYSRELEERIEKVLEQHEIGFKAERVFIDDENMFETIYYMEVMRNGE